MLHGSRAGVAEPRRAPRTARLSSVAYAAKTPLCQECAKTGKHGPKFLRQRGHEPAAELGISRRDDTAWNALDRLARFYTTPAVAPADSPTAEAPAAPRRLRF
jgi:hypothetical protein